MNYEKNMAIWRYKKKRKAVRIQQMNWAGLQGVRNYRNSKTSKFEAKKKRYVAKQKGNPTSAELKLWKQLKRYGFGFQIPITIRKKYFYIADFYHQAARLVVEVDGGYHDTEQQKVKDEARTINLKHHKDITVIRFTNSEVYEAMDRVVDEITGLVRVSLAGIRCEYEALRESRRSGSHRLCSDRKLQNEASTEKLINSGTINQANMLLH